MQYIKMIQAFVVLLVFFHQALYAQATGSASKVTTEAKLSVDRATAGSTFGVAVLVRIADGWHVNSHTPTSDYLIGTKLELTRKEDCTFSKLVYPTGEHKKFAFSEEPLSVYEKKIKIFFTASLSANAKPRKDTVRAALTVQACSDQVCLAPSKIEVKIPVRIVGAKEKSRAINGNIFSSYRPLNSK